MSDYPNLEIRNKKKDILIVELDKIERWYGDYQGDKNVRVIDGNRQQLIPFADIKKRIIESKTEYPQVHLVMPPKYHTPFIGKKTKHEKKMEKKARQKLNHIGSGKTE